MTAWDPAILLRFLGSPAVVDAWMAQPKTPAGPELHAVFDTFVTEEGRSDEALAVRAVLLAAPPRARTPVRGALEILAREIPTLASDARSQCVAEASTLGLRSLVISLGAAANSSHPEHERFAEIHCHRGAALDFGGKLSLLPTAELVGHWRTARWGQHPWPELLERLAETPDLDKADPAHYVEPLRGDLELAFAIACALRQEAMARPRTRGLEAFRLRYDDGWTKRPGAKARGYADVIRLFAQKGHDVIEWRPMLSSVQKMRKEVVALARGYAEYVVAAGSAENIPVVGLVYSLDRNDAGRGRHFSVDEARQVVSRWKSLVEGLCRSVETEPLVATFALGIDFASGELGCPPRLFREVCDVVHAFNARVGAFRNQPGHPVERTELRRLAGFSPDDALNRWRARSTSLMPAGLARLGITVHAGEDWDDPLTGLRHVDEATTECGLGRGDRIGHGLVLGLPYCQILEHWTASRGFNRVRRVPGERWSTEATRFRALKPRGTHLSDLTWTLSMFDRYVGALPAGLSAWRVQTQALLMEAAGRALGAPVHGRELRQRLAAMDGRLALRLPGLTFEGRDDVDPRHQEWCDVLPEEILDWLRERVLATIRAKEIVIESCPTSNRVVAGLPTDGTIEMPIVRLARSGVRVALASDDPGYFGSYVPDEALLIDDLAVRKQVLQEARDAAWIWPV
jgi:adenosine deaminase